MEVVEVELEHDHDDDHAQVRIRVAMQYACGPDEEPQTLNNCKE